MVCKTANITRCQWNKSIEAMLNRGDLSLVAVFFFPSTLLFWDCKHTHIRVQPMIDPAAKMCSHRHSE